MHLGCDVFWNCALSIAIARSDPKPHTPKAYTFSVAALRGMSFEPVFLVCRGRPNAAASLQLVRLLMHARAF